MGDSHDEPSREVGKCAHGKSIRQYRRINESFGDPNDYAKGHISIQNITEFECEICRGAQREAEKKRSSPGFWDSSFGCFVGLVIAVVIGVILGGGWVVVFGKLVG